MYRVTRLSPVSWAKALTLAWLAIAVVVGLIVLLPTVVFGALTSSFLEGLGQPVLVLAVGLIGGLVGGLVALALGAVFVFIAGLIQGTAFNWALGRIGGLEVDLGLGPGYQPANNPAATTPPASPTALVGAEQTAQLTPPSVVPDADAGAATQALPGVTTVVEPVTPPEAAVAPEPAPYTEPPPAAEAPPAPYDAPPPMDEAPGGQA